ncbi:hypothetical protein [Thioalkalivibrio sp. ALgr3]|uniref:hypothetical protein n=1 Tax=Thioalkalivibrio sp. ALgr3 TaxID=1239292 RepID=UPI00036A89AA|nr:hypothetical protein [Thioalkalivibrio sp. ALgr3]
MSEAQKTNDKQICKVGDYDRPTHRQLRRMQGLVERASGKKYSFLELARTAIRRQTKSLHILNAVDDKEVLKMAIDCQKERERCSRESED